MCDSLIAYFPLEHIKTDTTFPGSRKQTVDHFGEIFTGQGQQMNAVSPLTNAMFKIRPIFRKHGNKPDELIAYEVSINIPACVVGNNALMDNLVYLALVCSLYLLQHHLLRSGCSYQAVKQISLKHAEIRSATLTYLFPLSSFQQATDANAAMEDIAENYVNAQYPKNSRSVPATATSSRGSTTVKLKFGHKYDITSYVKKGQTQYSYNKFEDPQIETAVFSESKCLLRVEICLERRYLKKHGLNAPDSWKNRSTAESHYKTGLTLIRKELGLDKNMRLRRPKPSYLKKLTDTERKVAIWHFDGKDYRLHPDIEQKTKQYASKVKRSIEKKLRIDMSVPWRKSHKATAQLAKTLVWQGPYEPPAALVDHCFVRETVKAKLASLKATVKKAGL